MIYQFNKKQWNLLLELGFDPAGDYNEKECDKLLEAVAVHMMKKGFKVDCEVNDTGNVCEEIITILAIDY